MSTSFCSANSNFCMSTPSPPCFLGQWHIWKWNGVRRPKESLWIVLASLETITIPCTIQYAERDLSMSCVVLRQVSDHRCCPEQWQMLDPGAIRTTRASKPCWSMDLLHQFKRRGYDKIHVYKRTSSCLYLYLYLYNVPVSVSVYIHTMCMAISIWGSYHPFHSNIHYYI